MNGYFGFDFLKNGHAKKDATTQKFNQTRTCCCLFSIKPIRIKHFNNVNHHHHLLTIQFFFHQLQFFLPNVQKSVFISCLNFWSVSRMTCFISCFFVTRNFEPNFLWLHCILLHWSTLYFNLLLMMRNWQVFSRSVSKQNQHSPATWRSFRGPCLAGAPVKKAGKKNILLWLQLPILNCNR